VKQDYREAARWYRKAADLGDPIAQYNLGVMCRSGQGVPQNNSEAARWYQKAAEQGDPDAQKNLGDLYRRGEGVREDARTAVSSYQKAAKSIPVPNSTWGLPRQDSVADLWVGAHFGSLGEGERWLVS